MANFDENKDVLVSNEGAYTVYLTDPSSPNHNKTRMIHAKGKAIIPFKELRNALYAAPGNKDILSQYLTITDPDVRRELDMDTTEIIDNNKIRAKLKLTGLVEIDKQLVPFLQKLGPGERERVAELAIEENITDMRILTLLEKYTPYKSMTEQVKEKIEETFKNEENESNNND